MGSAVIYRQEIIQDITLFTSEPKARFYSDLFAHLDLSGFPDNISAAGRKGFSNHAKLRAAIVMKCECFPCITGLPIFELTTTADVHDSSVALNILSQTNSFLPINDCTFIADKAYDVKEIYNTVKTVYNGDCAIPLNKRNTKKPEKLPSGHPLCEAGFAMNKDGKTYDNGRTRQKYCCPFKQSETSVCPCNHTNWNNGKKNKGCTKYITVPDDYRLSIDRDCISFKKNLRPQNRSRGLQLPFQADRTGKALGSQYDRS